ncbi:MAG TPA: metal ABC transporter substrate-binding protein [Xanthobacteraceae bacterium]|nr:metal ABC transporter substrate-binding protein [Xanthobacteraceae bacterium]
MLIRRQMLGVAAALIAFSIVGPHAAQAQDRLKVLATFSILGDFVIAVGGNRVDVTSLVGPNSDAHVYSPAPADARKVADAKVVVTNGLGFEGWMGRLVRASGTKAKVIETTSGIATRKLADGHADPHAWQSAEHGKIYVANIRDALVATDPPGRADYESNAAAYLAKLDALDRELKAAVASIPAERRRIISSHDAFGYLQQAYGIEFIAPQGLSTESEASARDVARIITQIKREKIPAVVLENISDPRLLERIAKETGARLGGKLYSDALTDRNGDAPSYIDMMRHNMRQIVAALRG